MLSNTPQRTATVPNARQHSKFTATLQIHGNTPQFTATLLGNTPNARQHSPMLGNTPRQHPQCSATLPNARQHSPHGSTPQCTAALPARQHSPHGSTAPAPQPSITKVLAATPRPEIPASSLDGQGRGVSSAVTVPIKQGSRSAFFPCCQSTVTVSQSVSVGTVSVAVHARSQL